MDYLEHTAMRHATDDELYHHGILGQKWGVRRFQNKDGTLTSAGKQRYGKLPVAFDMYVPPASTNTEQKAADLVEQANRLLPGMSETEHEENATIAGIANALLSPHERGERTMEDLAMISFMYACDDMDQSSINSYGVQAWKAGNVDEVIQCARDMAPNDVWNEVDKRDPSYSRYRIDDASRLYTELWPGTTKDDVDNAVKEAKELVGKINFSKSGYNGTAWRLYDAVEAAGLSGVNWDDMTDAQWSRLNAELKKIVR